jgi:hypothetical protein
MLQKMVFKELMHPRKKVLDQAIGYDFLLFFFKRAKEKNQILYAG